MAWELDTRTPKADTAPPHSPDTHKNQLREDQTLFM